jgi:hypothetical protein
VSASLYPLSVEEISVESVTLTNTVSDTASEVEISVLSDPDISFPPEISMLLDSEEERIVESDPGRSMKTLAFSEEDISVESVDVIALSK